MGRFELSTLPISPVMQTSGQVANNEPGTAYLHDGSGPLPWFDTETSATPHVDGNLISDYLGELPGWADESYLGQFVDFSFGGNTVTCLLGGPPGADGPTGLTGPAGVSANMRGNWSAIVTYAQNDGVLGSDGKTYISLAGANLNHDPTTDGGVHWDWPLYGAVGVAPTADIFGRTKVQGLPAGVGLRDFPAATDAPWSATFDGITDDQAAIQPAITAAPSLWFPPKTALIKSPLRFTRSSQTIHGQGATLQCGVAGLTALFAQEASGYVSKVTIEDLIFDGNWQALQAITAYGWGIGQLTLRRCGFKNFPGGIIDGGYASRFVLDECWADGAGTGLGQFFTATNKDIESVEAHRCHLRWLNSGFLIGTSSGIDQSFVSIQECYIDLAFWLLKSITSNSGGTVTYTDPHSFGYATVLTDSAAGFVGSGVQVDQTVRVMTPRSTGTLTSGSAGNYVVDAAASFNGIGLRRGEIIRSGTSFAVIKYADGATILHVEEWLDQTTYQLVTPPPVGATYTIYGLRLGIITAVTATTLTCELGGQPGFFDLIGNRATPAAGTLYEIVPQPVYPIQLAPTVEKSLIEGNIVRRGWGDLISVFGKYADIIGNFVEDGFDTGITLEGDTKGTVSGNTAKHCGAVGIGIYGSGATNPASDLTLSANEYYDNCWERVDNNEGQLLVSGDHCTIIGEIIGGTGEAASIPAGVRLRGSTCTGNKLIGIRTRGAYALGDIYVESAVPAGGNEILDCSVNGNIVYQSGTNGQRLRYAGGGAPSYPASPGSEYVNTSGGSGTTKYVKESANDNTGWAALGSTGLAYGQRVAYDKLTSNVVVTPSSAWTLVADGSGHPTITLPNDGHVYRVMLDIPNVLPSVQTPVTVGVGTAAAGASMLKQKQIGYAAGELEEPLTLFADVVGSGQVLSLYVFSTTGTVTIDGSAGGAGATELSAVLVAA